MRNSKDELSGRLQNIFHAHTSLENNYHNIYVSYSFSENVLLPHGIDDDYHFKAISLLNGEKGTNIDLEDNLPQDKLYNIYRVPGSVHELVLKQFPNAIFTHQYSYLLKALLKKGNELHVTFYPNKMVCVLVLGGVVQLINSYSYETKEDAAYHLLNIRDKYKTDDIQLKLSGMIEGSSALYSEIYKYFLHVSFADHECNCVEGIRKYPSHYFSHLLSVASCV
jgi:hypothetical protein